MNAETTQTAIHETEYAKTVKKRLIIIDELSEQTLNAAQIARGRNQDSSEFWLQHVKHCEQSENETKRLRLYLTRQLSRVPSDAEVDEFTENIRIESPEFISKFQYIINFLAIVHDPEYFSDGGEAVLAAIDTLRTIYIAVLNTSLSILDKSDST